MGKGRGEVSQSVAGDILEEDDLAEGDADLDEHVLGA
jgi:hypothetical protein